MAQLELLADPPLTFDEADPRLVKPNQLQAFVTWATSQKARALDFETTGFKVHDGAKVFAVGIYAPDKGAKVVDFRHHKWSDGAKRAAADAVGGGTAVSIGHNLVFECSHSIASLGVEIGGTLWDNQAAAFATLSPDDRKKSGDFGPLTQKALVQHLVERDTPYAVAVYEWLRTRFGSSDEKWRFDKVPGELIVPYLCEDVTDAYDLARVLQKRAAAQNQTALVKTDSELCRSLADVELTGCALDVDYAQDLLAKVQKQKRDSYQRFRTHAGRDLDLGSHQALFGFFYGTLGLPLHKDIEKQGKLDKDVLAWFATLPEVTSDAGKLDLVHAIAEYREAQNVEGSFLLPWLYEWQRDGTLHFALNQNTVETRRFSSSKPNGQNIPTRSETGALVRGCIRARPGFVNYSMDESQAEYRMLANYSGEPSLLKGYRDDPDFDIHELVRALLEMAKRKDAKNMNFGLLYGMGIDKLARKLLVSKERAKELLDLYMARLKNVDRMKRDLKTQIRRYGYVVDAFGGRRWLEPGDDYKSLNTLMQMSVADLMRLAMVRARPIINAAGGRQIHQIHDEIKFQLPGDDPREHVGTLREIQHVMTDCKLLRVPLRTDCEFYTTRWNEAQTFNLSEGV